MNGSSVTIRPMEPEDIPAVAELEQEAFDDPWPESAFHDMLTPKNRFNLVLTNGDACPKGYLCAKCVDDEIQIHNIAVDASCRKRGYGRELMLAAEAEGLRLGAFGSVLDVRSTNTAALAMYRHLGYRRIGRRRNYYERPVGDALILFKPLMRKAE